MRQPGPTKERLERASLAIRLREAGMNNREIGDLLGISRGTASALITDPDGSKAKARKESYRGVCERCGGPTTGSNGPNHQPKLCHSCSSKKHHEERYWTRERVIEAIQRWATEHNGQPPGASDWAHSSRGEGYPTLGSVYRSSKNSGSPFATWADAIEAAGFPRPVMGHYERDEAWRKQMSVSRTIWTPEAIVAAIRVFIEEHGRPPIAHDWRHSGDNHPSHQTVIKRFGSFGRAVREAGGEPVRAPRSFEPRKQVVTIDELTERNITSERWRREIREANERAENEQQRTRPVDIQAGRGDTP